MSFPNFPNKYDHESLLNAKDIVDYRRRLGRLPDVPDLKAVLLCLERGLPERLRRRVPIRLVGRMMGELYAVKKSRNEVVVMTNFGGGSPIVAELAEEFVELGAKRLVLLTWGGSLQPNLVAGNIVVVDRAVRDEGTSHHYIPPSRYIEADAELAECVTRQIRARAPDCMVGTTWTTDAPYRETLAEVQTYQAEGVHTVEMESAGLFAVGHVRGVQTAAVVVIMDSLADFTWRVPNNLAAIQKALETAYEASIEALSG